MYCIKQQICLSKIIWLKGEISADAWYKYSIDKTFLQIILLDKFHYIKENSYCVHYVHYYSVSLSLSLSSSLSFFAITLRGNFRHLKTFQICSIYTLTYSSRTNFISPVERGAFCYDAHKTKSERNLGAHGHTALCVCVGVGVGVCVFVWAATINSKRGMATWAGHGGRCASVGCVICILLLIIFATGNRTRC